MPTPPTGDPALPVDPTLSIETDGSFPGLLSAYAAAYRWGALPASVRQAGEPTSGMLFGETLRIETEAGLASRVERGLERVTPGLVGRMHRAFLSERDGMEVAILRLADAARTGGAVEDWTFEPARVVSQWSGRVGREAHRMEAFVRFERHGDAGATERWVAIARPEYHVLPILSDHFATRYPTLAWRIVDARRRLALVHTPRLGDDADTLDHAPEADGPGRPHPTAIVPADALDLPDQAPDEAAYQTMWRAYFQAVTIPERRNLRLHLRHVPKRYWPFLTEKQDGDLVIIQAPSAVPNRRAVRAKGPETWDAPS